MLIIVCNGHEKPYVAAHTLSAIEPGGNERGRCEATAREIPFRFSIHQTTV
jgi:hypothetical protein